MLNRVEVMKKLNQLAQRYPNIKFWDTMTRNETTLLEYVGQWAKVRTEETLNQVLDTCEEQITKMVLS